MNGVRTTFMRRGYLLTALSALLLLAASAGTASAQITVDVPKTVNEGDNATVTVNVSGYIQSRGQSWRPNQSLRWQSGRVRRQVLPVAME